MTQPKTSARAAPGAWSHQRTILLLTSVVLINPAVLYILSGSILVTLALSLACAIAIQLCYSRFKSRLPTVYLINLLAILGIFTYAEVVFDARFSDYAIVDLYTLEPGYYWNKPYLEVPLTDKEYSVQYLTNKDGFRVGYSNHLDRSYKSVDWLFIGDSYTQGAQVDFEDLYTTLLYRRFPHRIVANAGISGFGLAEEYSYFVRQGHKHGPKIVFLQLSNFNDFMKVDLRRHGVSDYLAYYSDFIRFLLQDIKYHNPATLPLGRWTEPFYPDEESNRLYNVFYTDTSLQKDQDLASFVEYLGRIDSVVTQHGAEFVLVLLPTKEQISIRYLEEVVDAFGIELSKLDMERPNRLVAHVADSLGIPLLDVLEPFRANADQVYFAYDEHLTPAGHALLADAIAEYLREWEPAPIPAMLSTEYGGDRYPQYSTDGRSISYQSFADGNTELFLSDPEFAAPVRLTYNDVDDLHPNLSPTGDRIVYTEGDQESGMTNVVLAQLDGTNRHVLTPDPHAFGAIPSFAPDGERIAYATWAYDPTGLLTEPRIAVVNLSTGRVTFLTDDSTEAWRPVFSPDGINVAYIKRQEGQFDLFLYDSETGKETQLSRTPYNEWDPSFARTGRYIVYSAHPGESWDLFAIDLETSDVIQLTSTRGDEWDPSFGPGDSSVIYAGEFGVFAGIFETPFTWR